ncbi:hypothetical protein M426DRAFT_16305 [Hypoxylon sp. CI-4A]|nr:hypothetical protein M426DRAFT_16305 [Hypoxylon sp. CI-4A]
MGFLNKGYVPLQAMDTDWIWTGSLILFLLLIGRSVFQIVYNLYFHPLSKIPGPWFSAVSNAPYCWWLLGGRQPYKMVGLHNKYGNTVRIAPNEVSFSTAQSWKDIYAHRPGHQVFVKGSFYDGGAFSVDGVRSIISETRPEVHKDMRTQLSSAFSERAVVEQEELVARSVDKCIRLIGIRGSTENGVDLSLILESMTFDVTGDLAFGDTFGALDSDTRHPWITKTMEGLSLAPFIDLLNHYPTVARVIRIVLHRQILKAQTNIKANEELCFETVRRRILKDTTRKDFLTRILEDRDKKAISDRQIAAHASDFIIAGSDTTATSLTATVYFLQKNPSSLARLVAEVRSAFSTYSEITNSSTMPLDYLRAVTLEGMRVFPPVPFALPRDVPKGGDTVDGHFVPEGTVVYTNPVAAGFSPSNFKDPWSFRPERWIDPDSTDSLDSIQPWSLGPRGCIGRPLAWLELRTTLAKLIWVYDLEIVDPDLDWHAEARMVSLWKKPSLMVRTRNRGVSLE